MLPTALMMMAVLILPACSKFDDPSLQPSHTATENQRAPEKPATHFVKDRQLLFGDLHIHTGLSTDAYVMGVRTGPEDVYRFARGETDRKSVV